MSMDLEKRFGIKRAKVNTKRSECSVRSIKSPDTDEYDNDEEHKYYCLWSTADYFDRLNGSYIGYKNLLRSSLATQLATIYNSLGFVSGEHDIDYLNDLDNLEKSYRMFATSLPFGCMRKLKFTCKGYLLEIDNTSKII